MSPVPGFGLTISDEMTGIPGRELPYPKLSYKGGKPPNVNNGSWNILDVKFHRGAAIRNWWVLVVRDGNEVLQGNTDPRLRGLVEGFMKKCASSGMTIPATLPKLMSTPPLVSPFQDPSRAQAMDQIRDLIRTNLQQAPNAKPSFILVLLSNRDNYIYPGIKRLGEVEFGVHTVHMQLNKALGEPKKQDQYLSNVALKVNTKLGGINHLLDAADMKWLTNKKTMVVG